MANIAEALERKKEQLPQFDYMWRVELPSIQADGMFDPSGAAFLNTAAPALDIIGGGSGSTLQGIRDSVNGLIDKASTFARQQVSSIPGYNAVEDFLGGGLNSSSSGFLRSSTAVASVLKNRSNGSALSHRVFSVDMPYQSFETNKNTFGSTFFYTAANNEVGTLSIKLDEYEDGDSLRYIEAWRNLICNPDGSYNPPAVYKRDIKFIKMSSTGADLHITIYKNCFPNEIAPSSFSYDSNTITQYSVTFTGDSVEHIFVPANEVIQTVIAMQPEILQGNGYGDGDFFSLSAGGISGAVLPGMVSKALDSNTAKNLINKVKNFFF